MPLVADDTLSFPAPMGIIPGSDAPEPDRPAFWSETLPSAFRTENTVVSFLSEESGLPSRLLSTVDAAFDPFADIAGYENWADRFAFANSPDEVAALKRQIDREEEDRRTLGAAGWEGMAASLAAGLIDPINLIPVGGTAYRTYRVGGSILRGGLTTARAGLLGSTASEALLHHSQQTRTWGESAGNVAVATLLSGVLGGATGAVRQAVETRAMGRMHDAVRTPNAEGRVGGTGDAVEVGLKDLEQGLDTALVDIGDAQLRADGSMQVQTRFGMTKFVWKHGVESPKADDAEAVGSMVTRDDIAVFPKVARKFKADAFEDSASNHLEWQWRVNRPGADGRERMVLYSVRRFTHGDGQDHVVTIHVPDGPGGFPDWVERGPDGWPSASRKRTLKEQVLGEGKGSARPASESPSTALFADGIPTGERLVPTPGGRTPHARPGSVAQDGAEITDPWKDLESRVDQDLTVPPQDRPDPMQPGSVRLAEDDLIADTGPTDGVGSVGAAQARVGDEKLKSALGMEKVLKHASPILRTALSESVETRRAVQQLVETPFYYEKNALGIASDIAVEANIRAWQAPLAQSIEAMEQAFIRYRTGSETGSLTAVNAADLLPGSTARRGGRLTWKAFKEEVGRAMRRGDAHDIPEVAEAARTFRETLFDPLKDRAIEEGLLPEDVSVETATSYLTRVYDVERIVAQRPEFVRRVMSWLQGQRETAATRASEHGAAVDELAPKAEALDNQLARTEEELRLTEEGRRKARDSRLAGRRDMAAAERAVRQAERDLDRAARRHEMFRPTEEPDAGDPIAETLKDLRRKPEKPLDLTAWAAKRGGLKENGGELAHMGVTAKTRPGLLNNASGMNLDDAALKAWEDGYFPMHSERPTVNEFLDALRDDFNGIAKVYTEAGQDLVARQDYLASFARDLESLGLDPMKASPGEVKAAMDAAEAGVDARFRKATPAARAKHREIGYYRKRAEQRLEQARARLAKTAERHDRAAMEFEAAREANTRLRLDADDLAKRSKRIKTRIEKLSALRDGELRFAGVEDIELQDIAEEISHVVTGAPGGRIAYEAVPLARGPLKERTFNIPDEMIEDFLESDVETVARFYTRTMAADVELASRFVRPDMEDALMKVRDDYTRKAMRADTDAERTRLDKAMRADLRDIAAMRDRLRGTYAAPSDPNGRLVRAGQMARQWNYLRMLGGMAISAIPDLGRPVMVHGLRRVWGSALVPLVTNFRAVRVAGREAKLAGTALDMVLDSRAMSLADVGDDFGRHTVAERGLKALADRYGVQSLMAPWNAALKQWVGTVSSTRILEEAASWRAGTIKGANREYLAMLGIDASRAEKIAVMFDEFGERHGEVWIAHTERWTDRDALRSFRAALAKDVDRTIVTPGAGDRPLWMSKEWGKTVGQFKSFVFASAQRVLLSGLQQRDMATLNGAMIVVGLGMGVTAFKNWEADRKQPEDLGEWIANGVDRSGLTGWFFDVNNITEKATRGAIGLSALTGGGPMSRYASRNTVDALLGPTVGTAETAFTVTGAWATGDWRESDVRALRRLLPYQNLFYARWLFDEAEAGLNETLGAKR